MVLVIMGFAATKVNAYIYNPTGNSGGGGNTTNSTLTGDGSIATPLGINLANSNTWTAPQTITNNTLGNAFTVNDNNTASTTYGIQLNENSAIGGLKIVQNTVTDSTSSDNGALVIDNSGNTGYAIDAFSTQNIANRFVRFFKKPAFTTKLNGAQAINSTSTSITVSSTSGFPTSGTLIVLNNASTTESESSAYIHYTSTTATTFVGTAGAFYKPVATLNLVDQAIVNYDNTTNTFTLLNLEDSSSNGGSVNGKLTGPNPDLEFLSQGGYDGTVGEGKFEIDIPQGDNLVPNQSDVFRLNGRADANNGFNPIVSMTRPGLNEGMFGIGYDNKVLPITMSAHLDVVNDATVDSNAATLVVAKFHGATGQTADLTDWDNISGTPLASVSSTGAMTAPSFNGVAITTGGSATSFLGADGSYHVDSGGTVTNLSTDSSLTGGPCTTTCTIGINLGNTNTWTITQAFSSGLTATTGAFSSSITAGSANSNIFVTSGASSTSTSVAQYLFGGASTVSFRTGFYGSSSPTLGTNVSYGGVTVGSAPVGTAATGTHAWLANMVVKALGTLTPGGAAITNTASLMIDAPSAGGTNNYSLAIRSGNSLFGGNILSTGSILSTAASSGGIGYGTGGGAGGTVTQLTSKSTGVTLNAYTGTITMNNAALSSATIASFTVTDSDMGANDVVAIQHDSGGTLGIYTVDPSTSTSGSFVVNVRNDGTVPLSEAIVLRFAIVKGSVN